MKKFLSKINASEFFVSIFFLISIIVIICLNFDGVQNSVDGVYNFMLSKFGWFFVLSSLVCLIFSVYLGFGPYKDVRLGGEDAKPAFSTLAWAAMMFTTSCGAWLVVYGFLEPIYCASDPAFQISQGTVAAYEIGQVYAHFHWGPSAWCIYVPVSAALAYLLFNRKKEKSIFSDTCIPENIKKPAVKRILKIAVDVVAIIATVVSPVISIGTGMPLLTALIQNLFGISDEYTLVIQIFILALWTLIFGTSVFFGLKKGIKTLSNINVVMAVTIMAVIGLFTGIGYICSAELNTFGALIEKMPRLLTYTDAFGSGSFVKGWTSSYWACYFVYMPFMGVFNAKISKGRTLKELVFGQLVLCTLGCWFAMATFGNYSMKLLIEGKIPLAQILSSKGEAAAILSIIETMPVSKIITVCLLIVCFVFLATTMDSSSFVAAEMTFKRKKEDELAPRWLRIIWAAFASVISFVLLQIGGFKVVRSLCYLAGLPLALLCYLIIYNVYKMLKADKVK